MATRLPASQRTREELTALIEGRLSTGSAKDELVKLATQLIVEEALEGEAADAVGRDYYEHGAQPGQGYRNGYRTGRLKTAEGLMEYSAPQIAGRDEPFRSPIRAHLKGHTQGLEDLAAINRAGSTKPDAIQQALQQTDLKPEQLMMGYRGVKFDSTGQNVLAATYLIQLQGASYVVVWPEKSATTKLIYPFKGWE
jgi:hypothetical protein